MTVDDCIGLFASSLSLIDASYFRLETTYEPSGIVRERVFCYELYHQVRNSMDSNCRLALNGEIDKRGHVDFRTEDQKNPDFVFHIPGKHKGNTLVVEVKGRISGYGSKIVEDFENLLLFVENYWYSAGVFILYNHSLEELVGSMSKELSELAGRKGAGSIAIICCENAHVETQIAKLADLFTREV